jgi:hypothetical protein
MKAHGDPFRIAHRLFFTVPLHGRFLLTGFFLRLQYKETNVLQLREPSMESGP